MREDGEGEGECGVLRGANPRGERKKREKEPEKSNPLGKLY